MASKVKVLKINRPKNYENDLIRKKKSITTINQPWFNESSTTNLSLDFDQPVNLSNNKQASKAKITLIQNANSHFLKNDLTFSFGLNAKDVNQTQYDSITIMNNNLESTQLPSEIIKMRQNSYKKEQLQRNAILARINKKDACDYHLQNINLLPLENKNQPQANDHASLVEEVNDLKKYDISEESDSKNMQQKDLITEELETDAIDLDIELDSDENDEILDSIEAELSEVTKSLKSGNLRKNITLSPHQLDNSILDYTVSGKIDDMDREIARRTKEKNEQRAKNESDMTVMLNNIITSADNNKKINKQANQELPAWINDADELAKIKNLPKKEQKKLLKKMKRK